MKDLVEKARHTVNTDTTSAFRGIYDDKQGQDVLDEEEIKYWDMGGGRRKGHTVR